MNAMNENTLIPELRSMRRALWLILAVLVAGITLGTLINLYMVKDFSAEMAELSGEVDLGSKCRSSSIKANTMKSWLDARKENARFPSIFTAITTAAL
jgi:hypothetical protein